MIVEKPFGVKNTALGFLCHKFGENAVKNGVLIALLKPFWIENGGLGFSQR